MKETNREYQQRWRKENREKVLEYSKQSRERNKEKLKEKRCIYYQKNKNKRNDYSKVYSKIWNELNKDYKKIKAKEWYEKNKEKVKANVKQYNKKKRNTDPLFKLKANIRTLISNLLKGNNFVKKSKTSEIVGCSYGQLLIHVESQFEPWMNWDNYGLYNGTESYGWDIDHITPLSSATSEEELLKLNHFSNLQPLCSYINRYVKRDNL